MDAHESEEFIELLSSHQGVLFFYIRSLVHDVEIAKDILQETNMVLWKKISEFEKGTSFLSWSRTVARFQALAWSRDHQREKLLFNDNLVSLIEQSSEKYSDQYLVKKDALKQCLELLPEHGQQLISQIYEQGMTVSELAKQENKTPNSVSQILYRMRSLLINCMHSKLKD